MFNALSGLEISAAGNCCKIIATYTVLSANLIKIERNGRGSCKKYQVTKLWK